MCSVSRIQRKVGSQRRLAQIRLHFELSVAPSWIRKDSPLQVHFEASVTPAQDYGFGVVGYRYIGLEWLEMSGRRALIVR